MVRALAAASTSALSTASSAASTSHPSSPFVHLLRNSRFATFDPTIRQTYYSPKQFVTRGYWGLKRPIAARKKTSSFITIQTWEARQHYVAWDNAEDQVRFIRRMDELGVKPGANSESSWMSSIGSAARQEWLIDSEFSPRNWEPVEETAPGEHEPTTDPIEIDTLGKRGEGQYGARATREPPFRESTTVIPNVHAMSPAEFKHYIARLRKLRPAFKEYMKQKGEEERESFDRMVEENPNKTFQYVPKIEGKSLLELGAQAQVSDHHRLFLAQHTASEYRSTEGKIQPVPHRHAALTYSHPSKLDTLLRSQPKPGFVIEDLDNGRFDEEVQAPDDENPIYLASFAGVAAILPSEHAKGRTPLMDMEHGAHADDWPNAVTLLRPATHDGLMLEDVPRVVGRGREPDEGLDGVNINLIVSADAGAREPSRLNPYPPGSREYSGMLDVTQAVEDGKRAAHAAARGPVDKRSEYEKLRSTTNSQLQTAGTTATLPKVLYKTQPAANTAALNKLDALLKKGVPKIE
ncbi:hypothetical protein MIND_01103300 [Mycena indigotica]|uniref:Uncharacterized protein n=1 Tax=Mycena indigotica TaxID=2126181 RepID=A0A8H6SBD7_9AGAR|nr:uncharacterized protein MIND_01103300 [Mycena indigotica]KAF7295631.1 hypothetical protein MIND_01103300 [Mycena indigotica]